VTLSFPGTCFGPVRSAGDRIRPGRYTLHARFDRSLLLFDAARHPLFIVTRAIGPGPLNLVVDRPNHFLPGDSLTVPRGLRAPRYNSAIPRARAGHAAIATALARHLPAAAPPDSLVSLLFPPPRLPARQRHRDDLFRRAFRLIGKNRLAAGVTLVRGCGEGLTPAGDDFLAGWILACRLRCRYGLAKQILPHALGGNAVANAFLRLAAEGRVHAALRRLLRTPSPSAVRAACAHGHTSGADLLAGLLRGLRA